MTKAISYITNGSPWAIEQSMLETIISIAQRENNLEAVRQERGAPLDNTHKVEVRNGVAIIPITGPLFPRANMFMEISGAYSVEMLALDLAQTASNPDVKAVVLMIDSPGGHTTMINEFANQVAAYQKPIVAYVVGQAASAAYWIASAADRIVIDSTAMLGSIGVVAAFSAKDKTTIEIVSSNAQDKRPDLATDAGRAVIQAVVDKMETVFIDAVAQFRLMTHEQIVALKGGVLIGTQAVEQGFADEIGNLEQVILNLQTEYNMNIKQLKADHPDVYQAAFDNGVASVNADVASATKAGADAERQRIAAILTHAEATGREAQAQALALKTDLAPEAAAEVLAVTPLATAPAAPTNAFAQHMASLGNPNIGADQSDQADQQTSADQGWDMAINKVVKLRGR